MPTNTAASSDPPHSRQLQHNTIEPSRELSVGDAVRIGGTALACDAVGFRHVPPDLNEVRVSEHGTHPIRDQDCNKAIACGKAVKEMAMNRRRACGTARRTRFQRARDGRCSPT